MTFREKIRSIQIQGFNSHENRKLEANLEEYRQVRREGSQPAGTTHFHIEQAKRLSDQLGRPFRAEDLASTFAPEVEIRPLPQSPYFGADHE